MSVIGGDTRRYAAVEAVKLGHGGIEYVSRLLGCDPKTIRRGITELESEELPVDDGQRKKGVDEKRSSKRPRNWSRTSWRS